MNFTYKIALQEIAGVIFYFIYFFYCYFVETHCMCLFFFI